MEEKKTSTKINEIMATMSGGNESHWQLNASQLIEFPNKYSLKKKILFPF
jgi:hypothetical protein